jgi:ATP-dependent helicase/nuclease subunit A
MGQSYASREKQQMMLIDNDMGIALDYINPVLRSKNKTIRKHVISAKMDMDNLAEEQRILYVAMTRAKEKLVMIGHKNKFWGEYDYLVRGTQKPTISDIIGAKSYLDWCLLSLTNNGPILPTICSEAWRQKRVVKQELKFTENYEALMDADTKADKELLATYKEHFDFQYPYEYLQDLCIKTSVSDLKKASLKEEREEIFEAFETQNEKELYPYIPEFMREKSEMTGAERGTAYHRALELMDFAHLPSSVDACKELLQSFQSEGKMSKRQVECINPYKIWHFTQSNLASRMQKAAVDGTLNSEKSFFLGVPANAVNKDFPAEEIVIVQGIIDAYFEEDGEIVLLDYKTDRVEKGQELIDRYSIQMQYYVKALEQGLGKKVKEVILYSLALGEEVKLL